MYTGLVLFLVGTVWLLSRIKPIGNICNTDWNEYKNVIPKLNEIYFENWRNGTSLSNAKNPLGSDNGWTSSYQAMV